MNTSKERILETLENNPEGICDDCLSFRANVSPRQQVNTIARNLFSDGTIKREKEKCPSCHKIKILNLIAPLFPEIVTQREVKENQTVYDSIDSAEKLDSMRRSIIEILKRLDSSRGEKAEFKYKETVPEKIQLLFDANMIPSNIRILMKALNSYRNISVYDGYSLTPEEIKTIDSGWSVIVEWTKALNK